MKAKISALLCLLLCGLLLTAGCSTGAIGGSENLSNGVEPDENSTYEFVSGKTSAPTSYADYKNAACDFSFKMLSSLYKSGENTVFSPAALFAQMAALETAASGDNHKEIKSLTGKNISPDKLSQCSGYFLSRLEALSDKNEKYYIDIKNTLLFNEGMIVGNSFLVNNANYFNQDILRLDYTGEDTVERVNSYIKEKTSGRVNSLLSSLDGKAAVTVLSSAFIKDKWLDGYTNEDIAADTFSGSSGDVKANFMQSTEFFISGDKCTGFIKDFKKTPCRFIALLPTEGVSAYELAKSLDYEEYTEILNTMSVFKTCKAFLPQFSVTDTISFKSALSKNNADIMFTPQADFSGISYGAKGAVSDIRQSFGLNITPGGAGTTKVSLSDSTKKDPDEVVRLSRQFIFIIADNESNIPVFMGIISDI